MDEGEDSGDVGQESGVREKGLSTPTHTGLGSVDGGTPDALVLPKETDGDSRPDVPVLPPVSDETTRPPVATSVSPEGPR